MWLPALEPEDRAVNFRLKPEATGDRKLQETGSYRRIDS
jgi:hypothetical protein